MRKLVVILILTLGWLNSNGQLYPPIQPYLENDYSVNQVKRFALAETELSSNWRAEFLSIINTGLANAGESMVVNESNIDWVMSQIVYERRSLNNFTNSRRIGNKIDFFSDSHFDGMVAVFVYNKCNLVVFKTRCMNLLKNTGQSSFQRVPDQIVPEVKKDVKISSFSFPEDLGGSIVETKQVQQKAWSYEPPVKQRKKFFKRPVVIIGGIVVTVGLGYLVYALLHKSAASPHGTMSGGRPYVEPAQVVIPDPGAGRGN
jgi:hypothetical protein